MNAFGTEDESCIRDEDADAVDILASDFVGRFRDGQRPTIDEYAERHPRLAAEIRELFPLILSVEKLKFDEQADPSGQATLAGKSLERLDDFRLIREIGRGGMGVVFEAEQESLARRVAVKVLPPRALIEDDAVDRFRHEATTAANLHHPSIVPVFGTGSAAGTHYLVMQLVEGEGLDDWIRKRPDGADPVVAVRLVEQIADALAYAHGNGVLHRDIKPANLLIQQDGTALLTDFGLARTMDHKNTQSGSISGSLKYLAPERLHGISDEQSDVYSLGLTLFEMVTGKPAFPAQDSAELVHQIAHRTPPRPTSLRGDLPRDLETVILKAISVDPKDRYASAADFRDDLRRILADKPVQARRATVLEKGWRWCKRNRRLSAACAVALFGLIAATVASTSGYLMASAANRRTGEALRRAESTTQLALESLDGVVDLVSLPNDSISDGVIPFTTLEPSPRTARLLETIQPLYQKLSQQVPDRGDVILQTADAGMQLADIYFQLGRTSEAIATTRESLALLTTHLDSDAQLHDALAIRIAKGNNNLGDYLARSMDFEASDAAYRAALAIDAGSNAPATLETARAHLSLADAPGRRRHADRDDPEASLGHIDRALELLEQETQGDGEQIASDVLRARCLLARSRLTERSLEQRRFDTQSAIGILRELSEATGENPAIQFRLMETLSDVAVRGLDDQPRRRERAAQRLNQALEMSVELRSRYPDTPLFTSAEVHILHKLFALARMNQDWRDAEARIGQAISLQSQMIDQFPGNATHRCWRALLYRSAAELHRLREDSAGFARYADLARKDVNELPAADDANELVDYTRQVIAEL